MPPRCCSCRAPTPNRFRHLARAWTTLLLGHAKTQSRRRQIRGKYHGKHPRPFQTDRNNDASRAPSLGHHPKRSAMHILLKFHTLFLVTQMDSAIYQAYPPRRTAYEQKEAYLGAGSSPTLPLMSRFHWSLHTHARTGAATCKPAE
jgi:hypothetical protein